jgi:hypothetical protein
MCDIEEEVRTILQAGTYGNKPLSLYLALTSLHTCHWKAVNYILDSTNTEGWLALPGLDVFVVHFLYFFLFSDSDPVST